MLNMQIDIASKQAQVKQSPQVVRSGELLETRKRGYGIYCRIGLVVIIYLVLLFGIVTNNSLFGIVRRRYLYFGSAVYFILTRNYDNIIPC